MRRCLAAAVLAAAALTAAALTVPPLAAQEPPSSDALAAAQAALDAEDPQGALDLLGPHLKRAPRDARALLLRSTARCQLGELDACKADLDQALRLDPSLRQGWLNRSAIAIAEERYDDALAALVEAERLDPAAPENDVNVGAVQLLRGDLAAASERFRRHLARAPEDAGAWYLVASNYAHAGYAAFALEHLTRAIALDERTRARARSDANFADLAANRAFQQVLSTDAYVPPPGSSVAERKFDSAYAGSASPIFVAVLNAVQLAGLPLDPWVEITPDWALLWSQFRIKLEKNADGTTTVRLSAPPGTLTPATWERRVANFWADVDSHLLRLELSAGRDPKP
jgi:tetratricopeptide (TPR) repeat protein